MKQQSRVVSFDIARALFTLEIIAFWHLMDYLPNHYVLTGFALCVGESLTHIALAGFTFLSGYFLSQYHFNCKRDWWAFYKKRLIRFYPLFLLSALSLYVVGFLMHHGWFIDTKQFILCITGLSPLFPPTAMTLWYISMIMMFYMLTPTILTPKKVINRLFVAVVLLLVFISFDKWVNGVSGTLFLYYPFYVLGLLLPKSCVAWLEQNRWLGLLGSLMCIVVLHIWCPDCVYMIMACGIVFVLSLCNIAKDVNVTNKFFTVLSYSSMAAYLFHRQIYGTLEVIVNSWGGVNLAIALILFVPVVFISSYIIQKIYDKLCDMIIK